MNTMIISIAVVCFFTLISFFYGLITKNYSTVDRLWSILPTVYMIIWMKDYLHNPRYIIVFIIVLLWSIRLTTNFALKGGYKFSFKKGFLEEDYRWPIMKQKIPNRILFELFNLAFISCFQMALIFTFTLPLYYYGRIEGAITGIEICLYAIHLFLLSTEMYADILQLKFYKRRDLEPWKNERRYKLGFNTFGVWKISRHPNYFCEISQWFVVYLYLFVTTQKLHFSGLGALVLLILFMGSTKLAESITSTKYPEYSQWKKITSVHFPVKSFFTIKQRRKFLSER